MTKLDAVHKIDGSHVFSGVEHGCSVSLIITPEGRMTLSIIADGAVWSGFGHALPEGEPPEGDKPPSKPTQGAER